VSYRPDVPFGQQLQVAFSFDTTASLNRLLADGATAVSIWFDALNFQAPSSVDLGHSFLPTALEINPTPEPTTLSLLGIGLAAIGWQAQRRRSRVFVARS